METSVFYDIEVKRAALEVCNDISLIIDKELNKILRSRHDNQQIVGLLQLLTSKIQSSTLKQKIQEIIVSSAVSSEKISPGSFQDCLTSIIHNLRTGSKQEFEAVDCVGELPDRVTIEKIVDDEVSCEQTKTCLRHALQMSGVSGKVVIERTKSETFSVEQTTGYTFDIDPMFPVIAKLTDPKILCIDGYVESVAEINRILQDLSEIHVPCLMFVRGMAPEVLHTLKLNYDRGSLKVVPFIVRYDLEGVNVLNDLAAISGSDVVSSLKGQLISTINIADVGDVESAIVNQDKLTLVNSRTKHLVKSHVNHLLAKRADSHESAAGFLDKRIKSLSSGQVVIRIPDDQLYVSRSQSVDYALRKIKHVIDYGVIGEKSSTHDFIVNLFALKCSNMLQKIGSYVEKNSSSNEFFPH